MFEGTNGNGVSVGSTDAAETRKAVNESIVADADLGVKRERYYHRPEIVRCRVPNPGNRSGYGYRYRWSCGCGAKARRTWRYIEIGWPTRFIHSMVQPPRWQSMRVDHTSAAESACDHVRNVTGGPNRGHRKAVCAFYCGGNRASCEVDGLFACDRCAQEVRQ
jgi:hypothetical protein